MNRLALLIAVALSVSVILISISSASQDEAQGQRFKRELYRVILDRDIMDRPALVTVWQKYGEMKAKWRSELFYAEFPSESKYRYTFKEELECRAFLAEQWSIIRKQKSRFTDRYLDNLVTVKDSRYFKEHIYSHFKKGSWRIDGDKLFLDEYKKWRKKHLKGPKKETRIKLEKIELAEW
jgi:hypothetical protein